MTLEEAWGRTTRFHWKMRMNDNRKSRMEGLRQNAPRIIPSAGRLSGVVSLGYSLTEVLVVMVIFAVLGVFSFTAVSGVRRTLEGARCANNLRQIGQIIHLYAADNNGCLLPTLHYNLGSNNSGRTWVRILHEAGYFEKGSVLGNRPDYPSWHMNPQGIFTCPSLVTREEALRNYVSGKGFTPEQEQSGSFYTSNTHYGMARHVAGVENAIAYEDAPHPLSRFTSPSTTMIVGETTYQYLIHAHDAKYHATPHGGSYYLNLDGSVHFWEGPLPTYSLSSQKAPPFWNERAQ